MAQTSGCSSTPEAVRGPGHAEAEPLLLKELETVMDHVDLYVGGRDLGIMNLSGHSTAVMPAGFQEYVATSRCLSRSP